MREARVSPNRRREVRHWVPTLLVLVLLGTAVAAYRWDLGPRHLPSLVVNPATHPEAVAPPAGLDLPPWTPPSLPDSGDAGDGPATPISVKRVERALAPALADPDLGAHVVAAVAGLGSTAPVWTWGDGHYLPASTTKMLTLGSVLELLGPEHRFTTRVVTGATPREIVLVGGGDPFLSSKALTSEEAATVYPPRADLTALAATTVRALDGSRRVKVRFDDSLFTGPVDNPAWRPDYVAGDIVSPITALMVDGGREDDSGARSADPSLAAAQAFARALTRAGLKVVGAPRRVRSGLEAEELAAVDSAPLADIVERILDVSDNEGAEVMGHQVGVATSGEGSFAAGSAGVLSTLEGLGLDVSGDELYDGSGLSRRNRITTATVLGLLQHAAAPEGDRMRSLISGLPVAGFTGSLTYRFDAGSPLARGLVRAKTGTLSGVHALAGVAVGRDGAPMVFVIAADRVRLEDSLDAQETIDQVAAALAACRCSRRPG